MLHDQKPTISFLQTSFQTPSAQYSIKIPPQKKKIQQKENRNEGGGEDMNVVIESLDDTWSDDTSTLFNISRIIHYWQC